MVCNETKYGCNSYSNYVSTGIVKKILKYDFHIRIVTCINILTNKSPTFIRVSYHCYQFNPASCVSKGDTTELENIMKKGKVTMQWVYNYFPWTTRVLSVNWYGLNLLRFYFSHIFCVEWHLRFSLLVYFLFTPISGIYLWKKIAALYSLRIRKFSTLHMFHVVLVNKIIFLLEFPWYSCC